MTKSVIWLGAISLATSVVVSADETESILKPINDQIPGEFYGRLQFLGMYRDFDDGNNGHSSTLGAILGYKSPEWSGFELGVAYNHAETLFDGGNTDLLANDDIHVLNEAWLRYRMEYFGLSKTSIQVGRQIVNGEVFRKDDFRQKSRSLEAVQLVSEELENFQFFLGHATKLSNWIDGGDKWEFNDFGEVFGEDYDTDGVTWGEVHYTGIEDWKISVYDAYAWDIANMWGTRIQFDLCDEVSLIGYYRHEGDVGKAESRSSDAYGFSYQQKVGDFTLEPGYFGVRGSDLRFQELTTGINHPLGSSMMVCSCQFNGGADTAYFKATTKIGETSLYALYNYTWHESGAGHPNFDGQELNVVIKRPLWENLTASIKAGIGHRDGKSGTDNQTFSDARLFLTYSF